MAVLASAVQGRRQGGREGGHCQRRLKGRRRRRRGLAAAVGGGGHEALGGLLGPESLLSTT